MQNPFTIPLDAQGTHARWVVTAGGNEDNFLQSVPQLFHPVKNVMPFLLNLVAKLPAIERAYRGEFDILDFPDVGGLVEGVPSVVSAPRLRAKHHPGAGLAHALWLYWSPELMTRDEWTARKVLRSDVKPAYVWWLWHDKDTGKVDGAFRKVDRFGRPVPVYEIDRRPLADLGEALAAPGELAELFKL